MGTSLTVYTVADGPQYAHHIQPWWNSLTLTTPQPDRVVIVHGPHDTAGTRTLTDPRITFIEMPEPFHNGYFNAGVQATHTEWVAYCGIDDRILPRAYKEIPTTTEHILAGNILITNGTAWHGQWNPELLQHTNTLPAHSPYRRKLWEQAGGYPNIHWSDWGFWLRCAKLKPTAKQSTEYQALFNLGETTETMSGPLLPEHKRTHANNEIETFKETLR